MPKAGPIWSTATTTAGESSPRATAGRIPDRARTPRARRRRLPDPSDAVPGEEREHARGGARRRGPRGPQYATRPPRVIRPAGYTGRRGDAIPVVTASTYNREGELTSRRYPARNETKWAYL